MTGVLEQVIVNVGQQVAPGTNLARVADPTRLKAELRIAETQARDLTIGQKAKVDTRSGIIEGNVIRIDPAAQQGTVTVDVELIGELPRGARPDLSVDGTIELERLDNVLSRGPSGVRTGAEHGQACSSSIRPPAKPSARRCNWAAARSTPSRFSAGSAEGRSGRALGHVGVGSVRSNSFAIRQGPDVS